MIGHTVALAAALSLTALLTACGGRAVASGETEASEDPPTPGAGGTANSSNGGTSGRANGGAPGSSGAGATMGGSGGGASGGSRNGNGGAATNAGGMEGDAGATLSAPEPQVWVGAIQYPVTYPDLASVAPQHAVLILNPEGMADVGSVVLGDASPPPAAPDAFYPPFGGTNPSLLVHTLTGQLVEGVPYSMRDVRRTDTRLTFHLNPVELWKEWCLMRTSCPTNPNPDAPTLHAASVADLCEDAPVFPVCICEASTCQWNPGNPDGWTIDVELRDGILEGQLAQRDTALGGVQTNGVRLKRVQ